MARKASPPPTVAVGPDMEDDITYDSAPWRHRLRVHDRTNPQFAIDFVAAVGGSLVPDAGGDWQRGKRASRFLEMRELPATAKASKRLADSYMAMPNEDRGVVNAWGATAGLPRHPTSALLTEGEVIFYEWIVTKVKMAAATDTFDKIIRGFDIPVKIPGPPAGTPEEVGDFAATPSSGEDPPPLPKRSGIALEPGVQLPADYCDDIPTGLTVQETKDLVTAFAHKVYVAEVQGKQRKGLLDWLLKKAQGFKLPDEYRVDDEDVET